MGGGVGVGSSAPAPKLLSIPSNRLPLLLLGAGGAACAEVPATAGAARPAERCPGSSAGAPRPLLASRAAANMLA